MMEIVAVTALVGLALWLILGGRKKPGRVTDEEKIEERRRADIDREARRVMQKTLDAVNAAYHKDRNHHWR